MIVDLTKYTPSVYVELTPEIYVFPALTSEGKTYLCSVLHSLRTIERVDSHTYIDDFRPAELFDRSKRDLLMLDRYDLYFGQGMEEMRNFANAGGIVLLDCKSSLRNRKFAPCELKFNEGELVVYDPISNKG